MTDIEASADVAQAGRRIRFGIGPRLYTAFGATTALTVAMSVNAGTTTRAPGPIPSAARAHRSAAVPDDTATAVFGDVWFSSATIPLSSSSELQRRQDRK